MISRANTSILNRIEKPGDFELPLSMKYVRWRRFDVYCQGVIKLAGRIDEKAQLDHFIKAESFEPFVPDGIDTPVYEFEVSVGDEKWR
jgi:hypothetical protein